MKGLIKILGIFITLVSCREATDDIDTNTISDTQNNNNALAESVGSKPAALGLILTLQKVQPPKTDMRKLKNPEMDYRLFWINNSNKYVRNSGTVNDSALNAMFYYTVKTLKAKVHNVSDEEFASRLDIPGAMFTDEELKSALTGADSGFVNYKRGNFHHYRGTLYGDKVNTAE